MSAGNRNAGIATYILTTLQDATNRFNRKHIDRHADNAQGHDGGASHRIYIADGIGSRDTTKVIRIVDDRHKKIGGGNQGLRIIELVYRCVISGFYANQ